MSYVFGATGWVAFIGLMLVRKIARKNVELTPSPEDYPIV